jgi:hypothetical protein
MSTRSAAQGQQAKAAMLAKLKAKKPQSATYDVVLDPEPLQALAEAHQALEQARLFDRDVPQETKAVEKAERAAADAKLTLHFQALPRAPYEALLLAFPPTEEQEARKETYNQEAFEPVLAAATIVADATRQHLVTLDDIKAFVEDDKPLPGRLFNVSEVTDLLSGWSKPEQIAVWNTAVGVCTQVRNPTLPFGSRPTRG